jgi:hypothetical protein
MLSNPYEHFPSIDEKKEEEEKQTKEEKTTPEEPNRKMGSGCVGAYSCAIYNAANHLTHIVKERHKAPFLALSQGNNDKCPLPFWMPVRRMIRYLW